MQLNEDKLNLKCDLHQSNGLHNLSLSEEVCTFYGCVSFTSFQKFAVSQGEGLLCQRKEMHTVTHDFLHLILICFVSLNRLNFTT